MRTIKFRAWNKKAQRRATYEELLGDIKVGATVNPPSILKIEDKNYDIMQFTGLIDKNGEVIYEGDIVNTDKEDGVEVYYSKGNYWAGIYQLAYLGVAGVEVIGNIYETPELINKQ